MLPRSTELKALLDLTTLFPATAILGPRQAGKTTLARQFGAAHFFDLENPRDAALMENPQLALERLEGLIVIDEIHRHPNLFPLLRHLIDTRPDQRYLLLGSASRDLIRQSAESLAGRIAYYELGGFRLDDVSGEAWRDLWLRGGLPRSFLAESDSTSFQWREHYIATFLERDLPQLGINIPPATLRRFWMMLCHYHGQTVNYMEFSRSFGISDTTVRNYLEILEGTFMVRLLQPWHVNISKRLVKRPKVYFRDTGLLHTLMSVRNERDLSTHNKLGASWEGFALECATRSIGKRNEELAFWATHSGAEVDLFWQEHGKNWGIEVKYSDAPRSTKSMHSAFEDLELDHLWVVYPGDRKYPLAPGITALPISEIGATWNYP